jgi:hypothetical protein
LIIYPDSGEVVGAPDFSEVFVHERIISAVKRVEFVSDRMSYIILRGRWSHVIVLNVHAPTEDKTDNVRDSIYEELECMFDKFPKYHKKILLGDFDVKVGKEDIFKLFPKYHKKILLGDFSVKVGREDIFKLTIKNESLHEINNDNGVGVVNLATSKNLKVKKILFPHLSDHKYTWSSPNRKTNNQIDHILIDRRRHSDVLDVQSFRAADCDTGHYLLVPKVSFRLAVSKQ